MGRGAVTCRETSLEGHVWRVTLFMGYSTEEDARRIVYALRGIGCGGAALEEAEAHLLRNSERRGLTYSNVRRRWSVVAVGECRSRADMVNTVGHELLHVVAHACEEDGIEMKGEEPCYMMGELCERVFEQIY